MDEYAIRWTGLDFTFKNAYMYGDTVRSAIMGLLLVVKRIEVDIPRDMLLLIINLL